MTSEKPVEPGTALFFGTTRQAPIVVHNRQLPSEPGVEIFFERCRARPGGTLNSFSHPVWGGTVFNRCLALQRVTPGIFGKDANIGFRDIVLYPQITIFSGGVKVPRPLGYG